MNLSPAAKAMIDTLRQLGYSLGEPDPSTATSPIYPPLRIDFRDPDRPIITWMTNDCEDGRITNPQDESHGREIALQLVASAIAAKRHSTRVLKLLKKRFP